MKFVVALVAAGAAVASAQSVASLVAEIPTCADACLVQYITQVCGSITDYACQCNAANTATLTADLTPCVLKACTTAEALQLQSLTGQICSAYSAEAAVSGTATSAAASSSVLVASSSVLVASSSVVVSTTVISTSVLVAATTTSTMMSSSSSMMSSSSVAAALSSAVSSISSAAMSSTTTMAATSSAVAAASTALESFTGAAGPMATAGPVGAILAAAIAFAL